MLSLRRHSYFYNFFTPPDDTKCLTSPSYYNTYMYLTYEPLWNTLKSKNKKKTDLCDIAGLLRSTLAKMGKEEYVALEVVERICKGLSCQVKDVIEVR